MVCDRNVEDFARQVAGIPSGAKHGGMPLLAITADEKHKTIDTVMQICRWLLEQGADRDALALAVGGGVKEKKGFWAAIFSSNRSTWAERIGENGERTVSSYLADLECEDYQVFNDLL